jgi:hypothetical protein
MITDAHHAEMARFTRQIGVFKDMVLSPASGRMVSDDRDSPGSRIDTLTREDDKNIYVFAARLSELSEAGSGTTLCTFRVSGLTGTRVAEVYEEGRTVKTADGVFSDLFAPSGVHIYVIPKFPLAPLSAPANLRIIR